ncbi:hypothetical protein P3W85_28210 [Cupriavidus basilensis]|uniref:Bro-N domain-containing protein n=1 Tax=Cupriavidus basilensis TaxID=68895 RepID=A0ABT6AW04_9BURK|nr:hypothetical protein [Cupriavidus basilensis]MDF3836809.1 hypothetical protein [Cupriavidus basilensis]
MTQEILPKLAIPNREGGVANHHVEPLPFGQDAVKTVRGFRDGNEKLWYCAADVCALLGGISVAPAVTELCESQSGLMLNVTTQEETLFAMLYLRQDNLRYLIVRCNTPESTSYLAWAMDDLAESVKKENEMERGQNRDQPEGQIAFNSMLTGPQLPSALDVLAKIREIKRSQRDFWASDSRQATEPMSEAHAKPENRSPIPSWKRWLHEKP